MKNINDILNESLLDDEDKILKDAEKNFHMKKIISTFKKYENCNVFKNEATDMMNHPIELGDLIIFVYSNRLYCNYVTKILTHRSGQVWLEVNDFSSDTIAPGTCLVIPKNYYKDLTNIIS